MRASKKRCVFEIRVRSADDYRPTTLVAGEPAGELAGPPEDAICEVPNPAE